MTEESVMDLRYEDRELCASIKCPDCGDSMTIGLDAWLSGTAKCACGGTWSLRIDAVYTPPTPDPAPDANGAT